MVEQDYAEYTEIDHAVWRFVLLQAHARLQHTAHPAYKSGLGATGISVERIPRIDEMNQKLSRFGWGAVCVDGFIPPRAFQDFQANRILPIAAEIRSPEHLAYTPAPDIIHEAAGHAPMLSEPAYAQFMQAFGATAARAFALPADRAVYQALHALSELKEHPLTTPEQLSAGTRAFEAALANVSEVSESARLARLYWWTAEYGLIGTPRDFQLYGAGLLSSLGESRSCQREAVRKLPLTAACVDVDYDITRAQPQLFVARDFEQPLSVLEEVSATLAQRVGGERALSIACRSEELATLTFDDNLSLIGVVSTFDSPAGVTSLLQVAGGPALARDQQLLSDLRCPADYVVPMGWLRDGQALCALGPEQLARHVRADQLQLELSSGITIGGLVREVRQRAGRVELLLLERCEISIAGGRTFRSQSLYPLLLGTHITSACAGAPAAYFGRSELSPSRVPRARWYPADERRLLQLYEQAVQLLASVAGSALVTALAPLISELDRAYPRDWLLRWNLLESLIKLTGNTPLSERLMAELEALEIAYRHEAPIASGLSYLRAERERLSNA